MSDVNATLPEVEVTAKRDPPAEQSPTENKLWLRTWDLVVGKPGGDAPTPSGRAEIGVGHDEDSKTQQGQAISLAEFRIVFQVEQHMQGGPWKMTAKVYNVPDWLVKKITRQYTDVTLIAGYTLPAKKGATAGAVGSGQVRGGGFLFSGSVVWFERGRDDAVDTYLMIYANCFDKGINASMINTVLPAGHTQKDVVKACVDAMAQEPDDGGQKCKMGQITDLGDAKSPRARTLYGQPKDVLYDVAQTAGAYVHVSEDGKVNVLKTSDKQSTPVITLNSSNGMIGIPHQNMDGGIQVVSLLNPSIRPMTTVKINEKDITRKLSGSGKGLPEETKAVSLAEWSIPENGQYVVWSVTHHGDTRGNPWYSEVMTLPLVPTIGKGLS